MNLIKAVRSFSFIHYLIFQFHENEGRIWFLVGNSSRDKKKAEGESVHLKEERGPRRNIERIL